MGTLLELKLRFRGKRLKSYWLTVRPRAILVFLLSLVAAWTYIYLVYWRPDRMPIMTEKDIDLVRLELNYHLSFWWNIPAFCLWTMMLLHFRTSPFLRRRLGKQIQSMTVRWVMVIGIIFAIIYGGFLYGLIASLLFVAVLLVLIIGRFVYEFLAALTPPLA